MQPTERLRRPPESSSVEAVAEPAEALSGATASLCDRSRLVSVSRETISVVICTHSEERWADLSAAVGSVQRQSHAAHEIVVVADHNPGLLARVKETFADHVVAVES